jgi:hypothetical protein
VKTSYWYSRCETDSDAYSIREKSKRKAQRHIRDLDHHTWGPLVRVTVEGRSLFEILREALGEGGLGAESAAHYAAKEES